MNKLLRRFITTAIDTAEFVKLHINLADLPSLRRSLMYRSGNLGMLELDIVVGRWAKKHVPEFSHEECAQYANEVLARETPDLYRLILGADQLEEGEARHYIETIKESIGR